MSAFHYVARLVAVTFGMYLTVAGALLVAGVFDAESDSWLVVGLGCALLAYGVVGSPWREDPR